jgi:hypothetical protein
MVGCRRVRSRRLVRVLGTAAAATAAVLCFGARLAPPVLGVRASFETPDRPRPTATPLPTARPTATATPHPEPTPTLTAMPTPRPSPPPPASPRPTAHPAPDQPSAAPSAAPVVAAPPTSAPTPPPTPSAPPSTTPSATPGLVTQLSALPTGVTAHAQDSRGGTSPYVVGADAMAGVAVTSSLALATLRRRGLL